MRKILFCFGLLLIFCGSDGKSGKDGRDVVEYKGIVSKVNGDIITSQDLDSKIRMTLLSSGLQDSAEIRAEVLKEMINEEIKWQCVSKFSPKGGWVTDKNVDVFFADVASRNNMDSEAFSKLLKSKGIDVQSFKRSIRINLSWMEYIKAKYGKYVNVSDRELRLIAKAIKEKMSQESFLVSRIFFPVVDSSQELAANDRAVNVQKMLKQGAKFSELARQFSKSPDAKNGGNLGWIFEGQISPEEYSVLRSMKIGESKIVRSNRGYSVIQLNDKKSSGNSVITRLDLVQVGVPRPEFANGEDTRALLNEMKAQFPTAHAFLKQAQAMGLYVSDKISGVMESMVPEMREELKKCSVNGVSRILSNDKAFFVFCILNKKEEKIPEPTFEDIKNQKINEKFSVFADKELYELQKKADLHVEYENVSNSI